MKFILFTIAVVLGVASVSARDPRCPGQGVIHVPHETDCTKFYKCDSAGNLVLMSCDPGTEFDPTILTCTWPNGNCKHTFLKAIKIDDVVPTGCDPNEDPEHPTHLPHPTRCDCFYKCTRGVAVLHFCPAGLEWNIPRDYCDWPAEAHCVRPLP